MAGNRTFVISKYVYLAYNKTDASKKTQTCKKTNMYMYGLSPQYIAIEDGAVSIPRLLVHSLENTGVLSTNSGQVTGVTAPATKSGITCVTTAKTAVSIESQMVLTGFTVDAAAYAAANITPGASLSWTFQTKVWEGPFQGTGSGTVVLKFYSADDLARLKELTARECENIRRQTEYKTGDVLADRLLVTAAQATEELRQETNFTTTGVNGNGDNVTIVNGTAAWNTYINALNNAIRAAYQPWNANAVFTQKECYEALRIAAIDLQVCKMTLAEMAAQPGAGSNDAAVEDIITALDDIHGHKGSHKDYMLYRWHRYHNWEKKAHSLAVAYETANAEIDTAFFPYSSIDVDDLSALLEGDGYENYIEALLEPLEEEQIEAAEIAKVEAVTAYADYDTLSISNISDMLTITSERLLPREGGDVADYGYVRTYLNTEIASALEVYGSAAASAVYTAKSWNRYLDALAQAQEQLESSIENEDIINAKDYLQRGVNGLIPIADGADYAGLEDAIASAEATLDNIDLYMNDVKGIGKVIAALGCVIDGVDLFPDAALNVVKTPYAQKDQDTIDDAESALRFALANLRFAGTTLANARPEATVEPQGTENGAYFAYVPERLTVGTLHSYLSLVNPPADVTNIQPVPVTAGGAYAGTGTVITYYGDKTVGSDVLSVPVASYTVVVKGDISGDAVIDSADAVLADLALNAHSKLDGAFLKAALVDPATAAGGIVTVEAFSGILNMAVNK